MTTKVENFWISSKLKTSRHQRALSNALCCGVAEVVACLPNKCETLSSNPSTTTKKKERK
jgi:hypothetical protein